MISNSFRRLSVLRRILLHSTDRTAATPLCRFVSTTITSPAASSAPALNDSVSSEVPASPPSHIFSHIAAFQARIGIQFQNPVTVLNALTHVSYKSNEVDKISASNHFLGDKVVQFFVTEYLIQKYPNLPVPVLDNLVEALSGPNAMSEVGTTLGVSNIMRWKNMEKKNAKGEASVRNWVMRSLIGAIYKEQGSQIARQFIYKYLIESRIVSIEEHLNYALKLTKPRLLIQHLTHKLGLPKPVTRLVAETGRKSDSPVFVVAVFSGLDKIGQGYGSSIKMAETRAVLDALITYFGKELKDFELPSDALTQNDDSVRLFEKNAPAQIE